jgi:hypothetical protein
MTRNDATRDSHGHPSRPETRHRRARPRASNGGRAAARAAARTRPRSRAPQRRCRKPHARGLRFEVARRIHGDCDFHTCPVASPTHGDTPAPHTATWDLRLQLQAPHTGTASPTHRACEPHTQASQAPHAGTRKPHTHGDKGPARPVRGAVARPCVSRAYAPLRARQQCPFECRQSAPGRWPRPRRPPPERARELRFPLASRRPRVLASPGGSRWATLPHARVRRSARAGSQHALVLAWE